MSQAEAIVERFKDVSSFELKDVYELFNKFPRPSIRRVLRHDAKQRFINISRGIYKVNTEEADIYLLQGDSRKLDILEDESVDLLVADHPWKDLKASKGGNRNLTEGYDETEFCYTEEDFTHKARVLKPGAYLIEMLPTEKDSNFEYLYQLKKMAIKAGFLYYAKIFWQKSPSNTGRTVKEFEEIMIFSKGKAKCLNNGKKPYATKEMLKQRIFAPVPKKVSQKRHRAEKPSELWEYLFDMLSEPLDIVVDQFGGSCNTVGAALKTNRNLLVFELLEKNIESARNYFKMSPALL